MRLPANQNSYHHVFPLMKSDILSSPPRVQEAVYDICALRSSRLRVSVMTFGSGRDPPVGRAASHRSRSSGRYRTSEPTLRNGGPRRSRRHRRTDARLTCSLCATSSSVSKSAMATRCHNAAPLNKYVMYIYIRTIPPLVLILQELGGPDFRLLQRDVFSQKRMWRCARWAAKWPRPRGKQVLRARQLKVAQVPTTRSLTMTSFPDSLAGLAKRRHKEYRDGLRTPGMRSTDITLHISLRDDAITETNRWAIWRS
jgi:hypothetical protein